MEVLEFSSHEQTLYVSTKHGTGAGVMGFTQNTKRLRVDDEDRTRHEWLVLRATHGIEIGSFDTLCAWGRDEVEAVVVLPPAIQYLIHVTLAVCCALRLPVIWETWTTTKSLPLSCDNAWTIDARSIETAHSH